MHSGLRPSNEERSNLVSLILIPFDEHQTRVKGHPRGLCTELFLDYLLSCASSVHLSVLFSVNLPSIVMSDVLKKLRNRRKGTRLFSGHIKRRLKSQRKQFRKLLLGKHSDVKSSESDTRVHAFRCWCERVSLELHPNVRM